MTVKEFFKSDKQSTIKVLALGAMIATGLPGVAIPDYERMALKIGNRVILFSHNDGRPIACLRNKSKLLNLKILNSKF